MLRLEGLNAFYRKSHILWDVSLEVKEGESVGLVGRNGVGKTTLLRTIMGQVPDRSGAIRYGGQDILRVSPHKLPHLGIGYVAQERAVFAEFTVRDNLRIASLNGDLDPEVLTEVFTYFPKLQERMDQLAGTLSGGERQMLTMARAFVKKPRLMLLDEPTEGLMPSAVETVENTIRDLRESGMGILLVEQSLATVLAACDRIYAMEKGSIVHEEIVCETSEKTIGGYLGVGGG